MNLFFLFIKGLVFPLYKLFFRVKVIGKGNIPKNGGYIICSNHLSFFDPLFIFFNFTKRPIHFMSKEENFNNKIFGFILKKCYAFPVTRGKGDMNAIEHAVELIKNGDILGLYPEGTRSKDGTPGRAKSGCAVIANRTGADVLPVAVYSKGKIKLFSKITFVIGKPISAKEIAFDENSKDNLRRVSTLIMGKIVDLWESAKND